ncbi:ATP synthase F1 subunit delta [Patescibacteria group bacterium AH-259-L05]|nr:ATP synthase F1 subunit delta [Patescibacteria group bacterium AH-259-L05]
MSYTLQQYAHALYECIEDSKKSDIKTYINNLHNILVKNNDATLFKQILDKVSSIDKQTKNITEAIITSANAFDNDTIKQIQQALPYKKIQIKQIVDPSLIGGAKIQIGDTVIDGSIKKQLNSLKQQLK